MGNFPNVSQPNLKKYRWLWSHTHTTNHTRSQLGALIHRSVDRQWQHACMQVFAAAYGKSHLSCKRKKGVDYAVQREGRERGRERERITRTLILSAQNQCGARTGAAALRKWGDFAQGFCLQINHLHVDCVGY